MPEGIPRSEEERRERHQEAYGTTQTPPRGTGLNQKPSYLPRSSQGIQQTDVNTALYLASLQTIRINSMRQWEKTVFKDSDDTTTDYLEIDMPQQDDQIYIVTHLCAVNVDKAPNSVRLFSVKAGQKHWLAADKPSAACVALTYVGEIITSTGQKMRAEFWNTDVGNDLFFTASGYWVPK